MLSVLAAACAKESKDDKKPTTSTASTTNAGEAEVNHPVTTDGAVAVVGAMDPTPQQPQPAAVEVVQVQVQQSVKAEQQPEQPQPLDLQQEQPQSLVNMDNALDAAAAAVNDLSTIPREAVNHNDVVLIHPVAVMDENGSNDETSNTVNAEDSQALGNRRFLILASLRRLAWAHARGEEEKKIVSETLVQAVRKSRPAGRFLIRKRVGSNNVVSDDYVEVDHEAALCEARRILEKQHAETTVVDERTSVSIEAIPVPPSTTPTQPTISDVLCGRGAATNNHPGNLRFRALISLHQDQYLAAQNGEKAEISRSVVRALRQFDPPGRFLKKEPHSGLWFDIGEDKATEKTSQAFREKKNNQSPNLHLLFSKLPVLHMNRSSVTPQQTVHQQPVGLKRSNEVSDDSDSSAGADDSTKRIRTTPDLAQQVQEIVQQGQREMQDIVTATSTSV